MFSCWGAQTNDRAWFEGSALLLLQAKDPMHVLNGLMFQGQSDCAVYFLLNCFLLARRETLVALASA